MIERSTRAEVSAAIDAEDAWWYGVGDGKRHLLNERGVARCYGSMRIDASSGEKKPPEHRRCVPCMWSYSARVMLRTMNR